MHACSHQYVYVHPLTNMLCKHAMCMRMQIYMGYVYIILYVRIQIVWGTYVYAYYTYAADQYKNDLIDDFERIVKK